MARIVNGSRHDGREGHENCEGAPPLSRFLRQGGVFDFFFSQAVPAPQDVPKIHARRLEDNGPCTDENYGFAEAINCATIFFVSSSIASIGSFDPFDALDIPLIPTYTASYEVSPRFSTR
jgi:hypothetical protein